MKQPRLPWWTSTLMSVVCSTTLKENRCLVFENQEATRCGLRIPFSCMVGICIPRKVKILRIILDDSYQPVVRCQADVRDKTGELRDHFCTALAKSPTGLMISGRASRPSHKAFMRSLHAFGASSPAD